MEKLKLIGLKIIDTATTHPIALVVFVLCLCIGLLIAGYFSGDAIASRKYNKLTAENEKVIQLALAEAEKHKVRADSLEKEANILSVINQQKSNQLIKDDKILSETIKTNAQNQEKINEQIQKNHSNEVNSINSMSDEQRKSDICTRLAELARTDSSYQSFVCR